jgi:hypothetical protein
MSTIFPVTVASAAKAGTLSANANAVNDSAVNILRIPCSFEKPETTLIYLYAGEVSMCTG